MENKKDLNEKRINFRLKIPYFLWLKSICSVKKCTMTAFFEEKIKEEFMSNNAYYQELSAIFGEGTATFCQKKSRKIEEIEKNC